MITAGCETDKVSVFPEISVNTIYKGYVYIIENEISKGYVSVQNSAPQQRLEYSPLSGGKIVIDYKEAIIQKDGSFILHLDEIIKPFIDVQIYDANNRLITTYKINMQNNRTLTQRIRITGSKGYYKAELATMDNVGSIIKNHCPIAWAGPDKIVLNSHAITLEGKGYDWDSSDSTTDEPGSQDIKFYEWDIDGDGIYEYRKTSNGIVTIATRELELGTHVISFKVTDYQDQISIDTINLTIINSGNENTQPIANAGKNLNGYPYQVIQLDGSQSYDDDGDTLSYYWSQTGGPITALDDSTKQNPTFIPSEPGCYIFSLVVNDNKQTSVSESEPEFVYIWIDTVETTNIIPYLVYSSNQDRSAYYYLYTMNEAGLNITKIITFDNYHSKNPVWSRSGRYIFFESQYGNNGNQIFRIEYTTGYYKAITSNYDNYSVAISPTTDYIAYVSTKTGNRQIFIVDYEGNAPDTNTTRIPYRLLATPANQYTPCFSADGNYIIYATDSDEITTGFRNIYKIPLHLDTNELTSGTHNINNAIQLTSTSGVDEYSPNCSVNNEIIYIKNNAGYKEIWIMDIDGNNQSTISSSISTNNSYPVFSPNGEKILFSSIRDGDSDYEIYIMDKNGTNIRRLTSNDVDDTHPSFYPNY